MPYIPHKSKNIGGQESEYDSDSIKQRQNSEKARQNGTHPDVQQDKNKSATVFLHEIGKDLGDTSRPYPRETMTIGAMRAGQGEVANSVEQRRKQES